MRTNFESMEARTLLSAGSKADILPSGNTAVALYGYAFNDTNADGISSNASNEGPVSGATAYLDLNRNGTLDSGEPSAVSDANGLFHIGYNVPADGSYALNVAFPAGYTPDDANGTRNVTLSASSTTYVGYIGAWQPGRLDASVFEDVNGNGAYDGSDHISAAATVFIDLNDNGVLDTGEPSERPTTANNFVVDFGGLKPGTYTVRAAFDAGETPSYNAGGVAVTVYGSLLSIGTLFGAYGVGEVYGNVYQDVDGDGAFGSSDTRLSGRTVYVDANANGQLDAGETSTVSNGLTYELTLPPGTYTIRQVLPAGWTPVATADGSGHTVTVGSGQAFFNRNLGSIAPTTGTLTGSVFNDANANRTQDAGETAYVGGQASVYIDSNFNGVLDASEPTAPVDGSGNFAFAGLKPGTYSVQLVTRSGSDTFKSYPAAVNGGLSGTVVAGQSVDVGGFGVHTGTAVFAYAYDDTNGNGIYDVGESLDSSSNTVFNDTNNNGVLDAGEPTTDSFGRTPFVLPPGDYHFRIIPKGNAATTPAGGFWQTLTAQNARSVLYFGIEPAVATSTVYGYVRNDANGNGLVDTGETAVSGAVVFADANGNGTLDSGEASTTTDANGYWALGLPAGAYTVREVLPASGTDSAPTGGGFAITLPLRAGQSGYLGTFMRYVPTVNGSVTGYLFNDVNGDGVLTGGEAKFTGKGITAYLDLNNDGVLESNEPSTPTGGSNGFQFLNVAPGSYAVRLSGTAAAGVRQTTAVPVATVVAGRIVSPAPLGVQKVYTVHGYVFNDVDGDGNVGVYDSTVPGRTIYADENNNGQLDAGETSTVTDQNGSYSLTLGTGSHMLRQVLPAGFRQTGREVYAGTAAASVFAATGVVSDIDANSNLGLDFGSQLIPTTHVYGFVVHDTNGNGQSDSGESGAIAGDVVYVDSNNNGTLDAGEPSVTTATNGWAFDLLPGTYVVRQQLPAGTVQTSPTNNAGLTYTLTGSNVPLIGFFYRYTPPVMTTATLGGFVFDDTNKNGVYDSTETKSSGKTVFLDTNNNGKLDSGEKSVTTGTGGVWSFTGLAAGTYHVRRVFPTGYSQSNALIDVTLAAGQVVAGLSIGSRSGTVTPPANTASLTGYAFDDANGNGLFDTTDKYTSGKRIFLDLDDDGILDANETSVLTDSSGKFAFANLAAGTYRVRRVFSTGYTASTAKIDVILTAGQAKTGLLIGTKKA